MLCSKLDTVLEKYQKTWRYGSREYPKWSTWNKNAEKLNEHSVTGTWENSNSQIYKSGILGGEKREIGAEKYTWINNDFKLY